LPSRRCTQQSKSCLYKKNRKIFVVSVQRCGIARSGKRRFCVFFKKTVFHRTIIQPHAGTIRILALSLQAKVCSAAAMNASMAALPEEDMNGKNRSWRFDDGNSARAGPGSRRTDPAAAYDDGSGHAG
jgi:hypothetical protein